jgi:photosystem II stability/assembly factor-like uncharacterized protein
MLDSLSFAGRVGIAVGAAIQRNGPGRPVIVRTTDGGRTWSRYNPVIPPLDRPPWYGVKIDLETPTLGFIYRDPALAPGPSLPLLRTTDGGLGWTSVSRAQNWVPTSISMVTPQVGYASGYRTKGCSRWCSAVWKTTDAGATWTMLSFRPAAPVNAVDFLSPSLGYVGGGNVEKFDQSPRQVLYLTHDGGASWSKVYSVPARSNGQSSNLEAFVDLHFSDPVHGWGYTGSCAQGAMGVCAGYLMSTSDGGRSWAPLPLDAWHGSIASVSNGWFVTQGGVLMRTTDAGSTWRTYVPTGIVNVIDLASRGSLVAATTSAGFVVSRDSRDSWRLVPGTSLSTSPYADFGLTEPSALAVVPPGLVAGISGKDTLWVSHNAGRSSRTVRVPLVVRDPAPITGLSFSSARDGVLLESSKGCSSSHSTVIMRTSDGGLHWTNSSTVDLPGVPPSGGVHPASAKGQTIAILTQRCHQAIVVSTDAGSTWHTSYLPAKSMCESVQVVSDSGIVLACSEWSPPAKGPVLLTSSNAGRTWTMATGAGVSPVSMSDPTNGWGLVGNELYHTSDAGRVWNRRWIVIPPGSR